MNFWQVIAVIVLFIFFSCMLTAILILRTSLKRENDLQEKRYAREQEWHQMESDNWRQVNPALQARIRELEATCRGNQQTIANLKFELANKDEFLAKFRLIDLYNMDLYKKDGDEYFLVWEAK